MNFTESIFKAYDIRGLVGSELSTEVAYGVGRAFADWLPNAGPVCVGYDMRPDSAALAKSVRDGLMVQGRDVIDIGCVASDMIYFAVGHLGAAGGAMITASHNPGKYNGIKMCREEARGISLDHGLASIRDAVKADQYRVITEPGECRSKSIMNEWIDHALSFVDVGKIPSYQIAIDAGNGMGGAVVPYLEGKWPITVTPLYFELDGTFPNHPANPLEAINNQDLINKIKANNLDFGIAFDGDGDRAFLVDETGVILSGSVTTALLAEYFLKHNPGATVLYNVNSSRIVPETITAAGGTGHVTKVGHSNIKRDMRKYDAIFAGEHSGHYYFRDNFSADSGLIAAICAIAALSESGLSLSELARKYRKYNSSGELNFEVQEKEQVMLELKNKFSDGTISELDGLKIEYTNWWFIVRPSNTEPYLRLNVEANSQDLLDSNLIILRNLITKL